MDEGYPRLLGDVGGTNARWAWLGAPGDAPRHEARYRCADFETLDEAVRRYLQDHGLPNPAQIAIGIATPVTGDRVAMTNHSWSFSIEAFGRGLGAERCLVLNDFAALAAALPALTPADLRPIGGGCATPGQPMAVLGAGTGLGVAGVLALDGGQRHASLAGEGGHVTLAATDDREAALIEALRRRFGHVSAERALSGPGLVNLYRALCEVDGRAVDAALDPAAVTARALDRSDPACAEALTRFAAFLGNVAGNLALSLGARGGVFIGGGIVPRLGSAFDDAAFRDKFEAKGRFRGYLQAIPTGVIVRPSPALLGAARALEAAQTSA